MWQPGAEDDEGEDTGQQCDSALQEADGTAQWGMDTACPAVPDCLRTIHKVLPCAASCVCWASPFTCPT